MASNKNLILEYNKTALQLIRHRVSGFFSMNVSLMILTGYMLINCTNHLEQNISANEINEKIENYLQQVIDKFEIPGITIAITQDERIIYSSAFGVRDLNTNEPLKQEHIFHMASISN